MLGTASESVGNSVILGFDNIKGQDLVHVIKLFRSWKGTAKWLHTKQESANK